MDHHEHSHEHNDHTEAASPRPLAISLAITLTLMVAEVIGGVLTHSLALLADAGHMATDVAALGLSLLAIWLARRPATPSRSYGFARAEVLAALVNASSLIAVSVFIFWEAVVRIGDPPEVDSGPMLIVAVAGLAANVASAWVLSRGGGHRHNLNQRGAFLHVMGDLLGSVGAIVAALIMLATNWYLADPLLSAGIGLLILWNAWHLFQESVEVLLESTPEEIGPALVRASITSVEGIVGMHDLHIWTVTSGLVAASCHVEVDPDHEWQGVLDAVTADLRGEFGIAHLTIQPEAPLSGDHGSDVCMLDTASGRNACRIAVQEARRAPGHAH